MSDEGIAVCLFVIFVIIAISLVWYCFVAFLVLLPLSLLYFVFKLRKSFVRILLTFSLPSVYLLFNYVPSMQWMQVKNQYLAFYIPINFYPFLNKVVSFYPVLFVFCLFIAICKVFTDRAELRNERVSRVFEDLFESSQPVVVTPSRTSPEQQSLPSQTYSGSCERQPRINREYPDY